MDTGMQWGGRRGGQAGLCSKGRNEPSVQWGKRETCQRVNDLSKRPRNLLWGVRH